MHIPVKKINISTLETKVSEEIALRSEELVDNQAISSPKDIGKSTWECMVEDNNLHFTTTLIIKSDLLKGFHCNCNRIHEDNICPHVVAATMTIRKTLYNTNRAEVKKSDNRTPRKRQDISQLINHLPHKKLSEFVISKARSDKNFRLLVQAYFIEFLPNDHLESLIENTLPILTKANEKVSPSKLNLFIDISKELQVHFKSLLSQDNLIEGYRLAYLHLKKSFYVKHYLKNENSKFLKLHTDLLSNFLEVYSLIEAPEYKVVILEQLNDLLEASYISASLSKEQKIWLLLLPSEGGKTQIQDLCSKYFERQRRVDYDTYYFLKMLTLLVEEKSTLKQKVADISSQEAYRIIHLLGDHLDYKEAQVALQQIYLCRDLNHPLSKYVVSKLNLTNNIRSRLLDKTIQYFKLFKDIEFIPYLKYFSNNEKSINTDILKIAHDSKDLKFIIDVQLFLGITGKAVDLLKKQISWELLICFDEKIVDVDADQCYDLYKLSLLEYLKDHFGMHSKSFVAEVFRRVNIVGLGHRTSELKKELRQAFPDRRLFN